MTGKVSRSSASIRRRIRHRPEERVAQILDEAIRLIGERGYCGLTVNALARRCGISNAGLLHHFASKEQILIAVLDELERREAEWFGPRFPNIGEAEGVSAEAFLLAALERFVEQPEIGRLMVVVQAESLDASHPAHVWFRQREDELLDILEGLLATAVAEPRAMARRLIALHGGMVHHWLRQDRDFALIAEWRLAAAALLQGDP